MPGSKKMIRNAKEGRETEGQSKRKCPCCLFIYRELSTILLTPKFFGFFKASSLFLSKHWLTDAKKSKVYEDRETSLSCFVLVPDKAEDR